MSSKGRGRKARVKRRIAIFGGTVALYAVMMSVAWVVGTRQAERKTEAMLDYAVSDMRLTLDGVIDTMLEHLATMAVRHFGKAGEYPMEEVAAVAAAYDIDEMCIVDRTGRIVATNDPDSRGVDMNAKDVTRPFAALTNGVTQVVSQPFRRHAYSNSRRKYLGVPFPNGDGYIQIGLDESRMDKLISSQLTFLFDAKVEDTLCYICADAKTGALISKQLEDGDAQTLDGIGFDAAKALRAGEPLSDVQGEEADTTFKLTLSGRRVFCRSFVVGGYRFFMIEPEDEFFGTRNTIVATMAVLLALVLGGFAFLIVRISGDAERLKAFYAAEEEAREKDMEIAKSIQSSALPVPLGANPYFRMSASMTPARDVGGDFYDFFMLDQTHLAFMVADVSGKGVTAALYMMTAKTLLKDAFLATRDPAAAFTRVNAELCRNNTANMFLTAWGGVLDLETGLVTFANAGHNPPVKVESGKSSYVATKSGPVLAFLDGVEYKSSTMELDPGEAVFLYTDGVTEALDSKGEFFGEERLINSIEAVAEPNPKSLCNVVRMAVAAFAEGVPQADDLTVLAVEYVARPRRFVRTFPPTQEGISSASDWLDGVVSGSLGHKAEGREPGGVCLAPEAFGPFMSSLHIILDEICSNVVKHSKASGFEVEVELLADPAGVKLIFIDDGEPYDPLSHKDPDTSIPIAERAIGGLGIMMVKKMADSITYERVHDRNYLTVKKTAGKARSHPYPGFLKERGSGLELGREGGGA